MLHLVVILFLIMTIADLCFAQNRFIERKTSFFVQEPKESKKEQLCQSCMETNGSKVSSMNVPLNQVADSLTADRISIRLFIDPQCKYTPQALSGITALVKNNSKIDCQIFVTGSTDVFKKFAVDNAELIKTQIAISHDIEGRFSSQFCINSVPAYIIKGKRKFVKVTGQPDLKEMLTEL